MTGMSQTIELHFPIDMGRKNTAGHPRADTLTLEARVSDEWPGGGREAIEEFAVHVMDAENPRHAEWPGNAAGGAHAKLRD